MVGVALNFVFAATVWWMWKNFKFTKELRAAEAGADDQVTIYKVYKMTIPRKLRLLLRKAKHSKAKLQDGEVDELAADGPIDVTLPLKGSREGCMRIIVQCED